MANPYVIRDIFMQLVQILFLDFITLTRKASGAEWISFDFRDIELNFCFKNGKKNKMNEKMTKRFENNPSLR